MWLIQILLGCGVLTLCECQGLSVMGPKQIRPNSTYGIALSNSLPKNLRLKLELNGGKETKQTEIKVSRRSGRQVNIAIGDIPVGEYSLSINSLDVNFAYSETIQLLYDGKTSSIFIQTDKPIYKPGDVLRFRVIAIDADTRPVTSYKTVDINFENPEETSIRHWKYARLNKGIFQSIVNLPAQSLLGNWSLTVTAGVYKVEKQIEVREYVLPKFFVKAYPSEILLIDNKKISVTVAAAYTFDENVEGTVRVDLFLDQEMEIPHMTVKDHYISGKTTIHFDLGNALQIEEPNPFHKDVFVRVGVMETFTNRTVNITEVMPVYKNKYGFSLIKTKPWFRPGLPFQADLSIMDHNGEPAPEWAEAEILISYEGDSLELSVPMKGTISKGLVRLDFKPPERADKMEIKVKYQTNDYELVDTIDGAPSKSKQYLRLTLKPNQRIRINAEAWFEISSTEFLSYFAYTVISRGSVITSGYQTVQNRRRTQFRLKLTPQMAPKARVIIFYIKTFLIYDFAELDFATFNNAFSFKLDTENYRPGQNIYVDVKAAKDSYIAFTAIDQSALLLGRTGHDLTENDVLNDLALYGSTEPSEFDPFHSMGLFLRATAEIDFAYPKNAMSRVGGGFPLAIKYPKIIGIRTQFPEAWLWKNYTMNGKQDRFSFRETVPDTITSWVVSGFALSPTQGLGIIKQPQTFVVSKPFYIVLNLPYSIKRNEVATVQVTIFNFLGNTVTTDVTLFNKNNEIEFVEQSSNDTTRRTKAVLVPTNNGKPISFMIKAKKLGEIAIKVQVANLLTSDAAEHMLRVTPESRRYENNEARFIDLAQRETKNFSISINIPKDIDEGSAKTLFTLNANLFGTTSNNLESLIRLPTGCGEQNMVHFVPNVVILDYLSESGNPSEEVRKKAIDYLLSGYQNQLKYKRSDGSFSIWGGKDSKGSTFLTAFVAKSFKIADKYIDVNKTIVEDAFKWLVSIQTEEGRFNEVGSVINAELQGGLRSTNYALTAYVLIAFLENKNISTTHQQIVNKTIAFLETNLYNMTDQYDLALATYALLLGGRPKSEAFLNKLLETSIIDRNLTERYWQRPPVEVEVEIAGYALLSYTAMGKYLDGLPIMRWLLGKRSALGGFRGTQDTFVGLKALAKFSAATSTKKNEYRVIVTHEPNARRTFDIDNVNSMGDLNLLIPNGIHKVNVEITGIGNGFFQVASEYYQNIKESKESFKLHVTLLNTTTIHVQHLKICVSYIPKEAFDLSNMALVEVFFPSGMVVDTEGVEDLSEKKIKETKLRHAATSVVVYYDNLGTEENCFIVTSYRKYKVALHRPAYVVVYDSYNQDRFAIVSYEGKVMQLCDICEDEDCHTLSC